MCQMVEEGKGGNICAIPIKSLVSAGRVLQKATANHKFNTGKKTLRPAHHPSPLPSGIK